MPPIAEVSGILKSQIVYLKLRVDAGDAKKMLTSLYQLRYPETVGSKNAQIKRCVVCGGDQKVHHTVDILAVLCEPNIAAFTKGLTPSHEISSSRVEEPLGIKPREE